jgi:hypothetical protein
MKQLPKVYQSSQREKEEAAHGFGEDILTPDNW